MIVLDASALIAHLDSTDPHHDRTLALLLAVAREPFGASPISVAEALIGPARSGGLDRAQKQFADLGLTTIAITDQAPASLARLRADTGLKMPECCVLLAAEQSTATVITFDERLATTCRQRGLTALPEDTQPPSAACDG